MPAGNALAEIIEKHPQRPAADRTLDVKVRRNSALGYFPLRASQSLCRQSVFRTHLIPLPAQHNFNAVTDVVSFALLLAKS